MLLNVPRFAKTDETILHELRTAKEPGCTSAALAQRSLYFQLFDLNDRYLEKDLEDAILRDIEQFLLELGSGFSFIARQKRIQIDEDDFSIRPVIL